MNKMDEIIFYTGLENLEKTKKAIRNFSSLRFKQNPNFTGDRCNFSVMGEKEDVDKLEKYIDSNKYHRTYRSHN